MLELMIDRRTEGTEAKARHFWRSGCGGGGGEEVAAVVDVEDVRP